MAAFSHFALFHSGGSAFLDLLFPNICSICGQENFHSRDPVCAGCADQWTPMDLKNRVQELAVRKNIHRAYSGWEFGPELRALIHPLKYQDRARIGSYLGRRLGRRVKEKLNLELDVLIPVPLHPVKHRERGYNQGLVDLSGTVPGIAASSMAQGDKKGEIYHISDHPGPRRAAE